MPGLTMRSIFCSDPFLRLCNILSRPSPGTLTSCLTRLGSCIRSALTLTVLPSSFGALLLILEVTLVWQITLLLVSAVKPSRV